MKYEFADIRPIKKAAIDILNKHGSVTEDDILEACECDLLMAADVMRFLKEDGLVQKVDGERRYIAPQFFLEGGA